MSTGAEHCREAGPLLIADVPAVLAALLGDATIPGPTLSRSEPEPKPHLDLDEHWLRPSSDRIGFPPGAFLRDPPPESATWGLADWQRWVVIDAHHKAELRWRMTQAAEKQRRGAHDLWLAVRDASDAGVSYAEMARLIGMPRETLWRQFNGAAKVVVVVRGSHKKERSDDA